MSNLIQWPRATYWTAAWNPVIGCRECSPACANCYARAWAERFGQSFAPHQSSQKRPTRKGVVFCGNMTDLFGEWLSCQRSQDFVRQAALASRHEEGMYLFLTKRSDALCDALCARDDEGASVVRSGLCDLDMSRLYFGFTAENQACFNERVAEAAEMPVAFNQWLSAEPLLGPIDMGDTVEMFKWVVVGCESGPKRRPCKLEWVESIVEQCQAACVPVFVKQLDIKGKCETDIYNFPEHLQIRQVPWEGHMP